MTDPMKMHEQKLDKLLDETLAAYSDVEPRAGLENRILANLAAESETKSWLRWWPAFIALAAVIIAAIVIYSPSKPRGNIPVEVATKQVAVPATSSSQPKETAIAAAGVHSAHEPRQPRTRSIAGVHPTNQQLAVAKQAVFPSPSPLTDQERLLFAYLRRTPGSEVAANAKPDDEQILNKQLNEVLPLQKSAESDTNTK